MLEGAIRRVEAARSRLIDNLLAGMGDRPALATALGELNMALAEMEGALALARAARKIPYDLLCLECATPLELTSFDPRERLVFRCPRCGRLVGVRRVEG